MSFLKDMIRVFVLAASFPLCVVLTIALLGGIIARFAVIGAMQGWNVALTFGDYIFDIRTEERQP